MLQLLTTEVSQKEKLMSLKQELEEKKALIQENEKDIEALAILLESQDRIAKIKAREKLRTDKEKAEADAAPENYHFYCGNEMMSMELMFEDIRAYGAGLRITSSSKGACGRGESQGRCCLGVSPTSLERGDESEWPGPDIVAKSWKKERLP